ncbi:MAG: DoxX family protein [Candidatus Dormibacteraeota bacterium]|nr:DoxX family protein [Candidatus Dormibacteraeota bacterium]
MKRADAGRYAITAIVASSGVMHFLRPRFYRAIVPRVLGHKDEIVAVSGAAELACAAMMTIPRTRRLGGWLTALLLVAVFPANVQAALDGMKLLDPPLNSPAVAWARLPLQLPMILLALGVARGARGNSETEPT